MKRRLVCCQYDYLCLPCFHNTSFTLVCSTAWVIALFSPLAKNNSQVIFTDCNMFNIFTDSTSWPEHSISVLADELFQ